MTRTLTFWPSLRCSARAEIAPAARCGRVEGLIFRLNQPGHPVLPPCYDAWKIGGPTPTDSNGHPLALVSSPRDLVQEAIP